MALKHRIDDLDRQIAQLRSKYETTRARQASSDYIEMMMKALAQIALNVDMQGIERLDLHALVVIGRIQSIVAPFLDDAEIINRYDTLKAQRQRLEDGNA